MSATKTPYHELIAETVAQIKRSNNPKRISMLADKLYGEEHTDGRTRPVVDPPGI